MDKINQFSNEIIAKLNEMAESNPYDRVGLLQAVIAVQCLTINYQVRDILKSVKPSVVVAAEAIVNGKTSERR